MPQPFLDFGERLQARARHGDHHDEIVVDNFAGGGGASLGIEEALGCAVDIAINHNADAIRIHELNHPATKHYKEDVWNVDPRKACAGRKVGLAWFSPDCRHFSRAKGGKPVEKKIRGLAWVVIKWAKTVKPRVICLENVREFSDWGPLVPMWKCCSCKWRGTEGQAKLARKTARCPRCDSRNVEETDAEIPDPTRKGLTFKRWVGILRGCGYRVEWRTMNAADYGAPTHRRRLFLIARCDRRAIVWPEPTHGPTRALPWRTAAECIDWSIPCPSIFLTAEEAKQIRPRIIRPLAEKTQRRIAKGLWRYVIDNKKPFIVPFKGWDGAATPFVATCNHDGPEYRGFGMNDPMATVSGSRDAHGLIVPYMARIGNYGGNGAYTTPVEQPLGTNVSKNQDLVIAPILMEYHSEKSDGDTRSKGLNSPLPTQTSENRFGLVAAFINRHFGGDKSPPVGQDLHEPLRTVTAVDHHSITLANLMKFRGDSGGSAADAPVPTVTGGGETVRDAGAAHALGLQVAHMTQFRGTNQGKGDPAEPMPSACAQGNHAGVVAAFMSKYNRTGVGSAANEPLRTTTQQDRFALVTVSIYGVTYAIADIGMRMLTPRELARAQGFPDSYILKGSKALQVRLIGNSVAPVMGKVIVAANYKAKRLPREARRKAVMA